MELRSFHQDVEGWHTVAQKILTDHRNPAYNYDFVKNHIENGQSLEITDKDMRILKEIIELCAHWKSVVRKILKSRELAKLQV